MAATTTRRAADGEGVKKRGARPASKPGARVTEKLSDTHRREHAEHPEGAKRPETRRRPIENSIRMLAAGKKEPR